MGDNQAALSNWQCWQRARADFPDDKARQDARFEALMRENGHMRRDDTACHVVHCVLAHHSPRENCPDCEFAVCRHCDDIGPVGSDHTCSCPHHDNDCTEHGGGLDG